MIFAVPFFKQTNELNCGPAALRMALAYLGKDEGLGALEKLTGVKEGKGIYTIQLAIAAASLGYRTSFYSSHVLFNESHLNHEFYQKHSEMDLEQSRKLIAKANKEGASVQERILSLEKVLGFVTRNSIPIVLFDHNIVKGEREKGYQGHFVPVVGYNEKKVYVHNPSLNNPQRFMPITREIFDEARRADGTDEDIVVVYRKTPE